MSQITIYTKATCPYCIAAKKFFKGMEKDYTEIDVLDESQRDEYQEFVQKHNHRTVPMIFIGEEFVGGYDNLMELNDSGKLQEMLT